MQVFVPFDGQEPKTRLADVLAPEERRAFAQAMLQDVLCALRERDHEPTVLATTPVDIDAPVRLDDRNLTPAVNAVLAENTPVAVVMADLPLVTASSLSQLFGADGDIVLAPGLGGGTNALVARHSDFRVDYHGGSYRKHLTNAAACGASVTTVDSFRLGIDIDEPDDLGEVLLHSEGQTARWLRAVGFELGPGKRGLCAQRTE